MPPEKYCLSIGYYVRKNYPKLPQKHLKSFAFLSVIWYILSSNYSSGIKSSLESEPESVKVSSAILGLPPSPPPTC